MEQLVGLAVPSSAGSATTRSVPGQLDMRITLMPQTLCTVRRIVADHLALWGAGLADLRDRTLLAVNELLTAVLPSGPDASLDLRLLVQRIPDGLCINVHYKPPSAARSEAQQRAEVLLRAVTDDYGISAHPSGTDTWVSILHPDGGAR